jgi:hypothetical protein
MEEVKQLQPAIFFDRGGTPIEDCGHLASPAAVKFPPGTIEAMRRLQNEILFFIVTNQFGGSECLLSLEDAERVNAHVVGDRPHNGELAKRAGAEEMSVFHFGTSSSICKPQWEVLLSCSV